MYVRPSAPLSIGGVVDDGLRLYRAAFSHTWKLSIGFSIALAVLGLVIGLAVPGIYDARGTVPPQQVLQAFSSPVVIISYLVILLGECVFYGALFAAENAVMRGEPLSAGAAAVAGFRRLPGVLLAGVVFCVAVFVGTLLLLIPGIYLWGKLQLSSAALFAEDASAMKALESSWNLTRGRWWRTVVIITVALIILYILALAVGMIPVYLIAFASMKSGNVLMGTIATLPFSILTAVIVKPVMPAILLAVHHDCKLRSEGGDLAERAGALGSA